MDDDQADESPGDPWAHAEPTVTDPIDVPLGPAADPAQTRVSEPTEPAPVAPPEPAAAPVSLAVDVAPAEVLTPADTRVRSAVEPAPEPATALPAADVSPEVTPVGHPGTDAPSAPRRRAVAWPVVLLALPAFVAIWSGWVGLGGLTGFGIVHPLPGIWDSLSINSAITLPIGVETYGAYALYVWLSGRVPAPALRFAKWSALGSLIVGALGQVAYHLLVAAGVTSAPWQITTAVACLPVAVLGMGAALAHLVREDAR
ncbi:ABC transporter permease [Micromonospora sp. NPDC001898]|uniref:ABC transporter permease n=1 Tax=Micromonospora sp. NPDC001898 TaxID=3364221 RepID=UPI0036C5EC38